MALERIADGLLDRFCQREIFGPLGMAHTAFNPPAAWRWRTFRRRQMTSPFATASFKEKFSKNASVLGGVAGHAGSIRHRL